MTVTTFLAAASRTLTRAIPVVVATCGLASGVAAAEEWGTIKGRFLYGGDAPTAAELKADKDVEVCGKHKLVNEELAVGADKGVANVVVFVRDKGVKVHPDSAAEAKAAKVVLDNKDCRFSPHVAVVHTGQPLIIKNSDTVGHNSNVNTIKNPPSNSLIPAGGESSIPFANEEAIPAAITCNIHPWMKAYGIFRKDGYVSVSAADGSFQIPDLPAGETIELQVWHERAKSAGNVLGLQKPELKWTPKGRFQVRLEADEVKDLGTIEVPGTAVGD